jgi:UDP-glucose:(heptosyl)LPS alpha-1,3-glucosyltransferase
MRIAIVRQRYNPYGGAERFVARAVAALVKEGVRVTVVARQWQERAGEGADELLRCNPFYLGRVWRDRGFASAVCGMLAVRRFDLVQSHERIACCDVYRAGDGVHAQWLANRARTLGPLGRLGLALNPYHHYLLDAERRLFASPRLRAVICNSNMVREEIRSHFGTAEEKLHVIHNGVDLEAFHPRLRARRGAARAQLGIADETMLYLFVGSGFERKGLPRLIEALARRDKAELIVVGKDKREAAMRRLAAHLGLDKRVHFLGGQENVAPWYGAADCFVLPSLYDPFPNAALEAMACGLPVIVSSQCGTAELIAPGENGVTCDAFDTDSIERCLASIATPAAARAMGDAARASVEGFGLEQMAGRLVTLYRELLKSKQPSRSVG